MVVNPVQSQWTSIQFLLFCTLPKKIGKKIYFRVLGVASNIMKNVLFQFMEILLTSIVFKRMVGFLHVKVSYPTIHFINNHMLYIIQNFLFPSKNKINCLWSKGLDSRFTKSRHFQWYTFIHIYNREISKPTGFKNSLK